MFGLQELFDRQTEELLRPNKLCVRILEAGLEDIGIFITDSQRADLEDQFSKSDSDTLRFDFNDEQLNQAGLSAGDELEPKLREVVTGLSSKIKKFSGSINETMQGLVDKVTDSMADSILESLEERMDRLSEDQNSIYHEFANNIESIWGEPLNLLQGLIVIADESAQGYAARTDEYSKDDFVKDLLIRIHSKAVQVSKEILILLRNGFPDGAQARWRTLHELSVIGVFISEHGEEVAERYVNHETIGKYKAAVQYNDYYTRLGAESISEEEIRHMHKDYLWLLELYGQNYKHDYGWAADALGHKKPTFRDIEASIYLDHHRPYYKAASANIHGSPTGVLQSLGLLPEEDIVLSGPSDMGLIMPAQSTVISLNIITTTMLAYGANIDSVVVSKAIAKYGRRVEDAFIAVETQISWDPNTTNMDTQSAGQSRW